MIVQGALSLSEKVGLEALTFGPLAAQLGISKSGIFTHFKNRDELLKAVIERASQEFIAAVLVPSVKTPRGLPRLRKIFISWVDYYQAGRRRIFIYNGGSGVVRELLRDIHLRWTAEVQRAIIQAQEEGHLSLEVVPEQLTFEFYGAALSAHHYKAVLRDNRAPARAERLFEFLVASWSRVKS
jgi:AcrR family transcriptional regulator